MNNNEMKGETAVKTRKPARYRYVRRGVPALSPSGELARVHGPCAPPERDYKKVAGVSFLVILLILIFFSKTIYRYNLPVITAVKPESGRLSKLEISTGLADWAEVENLYAAVGGRVEAVLVKEGEAVTEGQELYRLSFDRDEAERKLREIQNSRGKLQTDIQSINLKLDNQNRYWTDLSDEAYEEEFVSSYELDAVAIDIRKAREELSDVRERYDDGDAGESDVDKARYDLQALYLKREELERKLEEQKKQAKEAVEEQEKDRQSKLQDYESDIAALKLDLQAKQIELNSLGIQEEPYRKALQDFEAYSVITAPTDGTVISLGAGKGEAIKEDQLIASIGAVGAFEVECAISLDNNFVLPGDIVELSNSSHVVDGAVTKITPTAQNKTVTIELTDPKVTSGETFDVTFKKESDTTYTLVPNGALNQDNDGYFLNQVKRRDGILGQEYYLARLDVYIGDSDSTNTAVVQGITFFEPIALISDKPVTAGDVVSLSNAGDFFEN